MELQKLFGLLVDAHQTWKMLRTRLHDGVFWATVALLNQGPGTPGWLVKLDPANGIFLGHFFVPEPRSGHAFDLLKSGDIVETAGSGLLLFAGWEAVQTSFGASLPRS